MELKNNLYIFNLCEYPDIPLKTINRIFDFFGNQNISSDGIKHFLGDTPTCFKILDRFEKIDLSFLSLYSLISCEVNQYLIDKLRESFNSIEDLSKNISKLDSFHFQERTLIKIETFLNAHKDPATVAEEILKDVVIKTLAGAITPIKQSDLFAVVVNAIGSISASDFCNKINELALSGDIKITEAGLEIKRPTIQEYFDKYIDSSKKIAIVEQNVKGTNIQRIADSLRITRQRVDQILKDQVIRMPVFDNELRYKLLMSEYSLSYAIMDRLGYGDKELINYVKLKYSTKPEKNEVDYVTDVNDAGQSLIGTDLGAYILNENKLAYVNGKLLKKDFRSLFCEFVESNDIIVFNSKDAIRDFKLFLNTNHIDLGLNELTFDVMNRKIENLGIFLNCGSHNFYRIDLEKMSSEFLEATRHFLENFYGFCSSAAFLSRNKELCEREHITDESQLFAVLKYLYSKEFEEDIDFIRTPTISTKGLDRDEFYENLLADLQPVSVSDFLDYVADEYGFNKSSLYSERLSFINKYIDPNGILRLDNYLDPSDPDILTLNSMLGNRKVIPLNEYVEMVRTQLPNKADYFTSKYVIKKLGYSYRTDSIYLDEYNSLFDAMLAVSKDLNISVSESLLSKYLPVDSLNTRYSLIKQSAMFLKFSDSSYLNISKMIDRERLLCYRDELIDSLTPDTIYTLSDMMDTVFYKRLSEKYPDIAKIFEAVGYKLLINLLQGSLTITSLESEDPFVFGKGTLVSNKKVIKCIVKERGSIDKMELIDLLSSKYGINHEYWKGYFFELGLYYNNHTDKVYISKERCDQELQDYLNREGLN